MSPLLFAMLRGIINHLRCLVCMSAYDAKDQQRFVHSSDDSPELSQPQG